MSSQSKILILGGAGMLGHKLWQLLPERFPNTWVTIRKPRTHYKKYGKLFDSDRVLENVDVSDVKQVYKVLDQIRPSVIVNCVAITKRHERPEESAAVVALNSLLPHQLAQWGHQNQARVIHFSTDCVFNGETGGYRETDTPNAADLYGQSKALGELKRPGCFTLRSSFIGRELETGTELVEWFLSQKGKTVCGYTQATYSGMTTIQGAKVVGDVIEKWTDLDGVWQVASAKINKFELLQILNRVFENGSEVIPEEKFTCHRHLNGERFFEKTGFKLPTWEAMILEMKNDPTPYAQWRNEK